MNESKELSAVNYSILMEEDMCYSLCVKWHYAREQRKNTHAEYVSVLCFAISHSVVPPSGQKDYGCNHKHKFPGSRPHQIQ